MYEASGEVPVRFAKTLLWIKDAINQENDRERAKLLTDTRMAHNFHSLDTARREGQKGRKERVKGDPV